MNAASLLLALLLLTMSGAARAQVEMQLEVSARAVEVGQQFEVTLNAQSTEGSPSAAKLNVPSGFTVQGPSIGTSWQMGITNGRITRSKGLTARWGLTAQRTGKFTIGPATVEQDGSVYRSGSASIEVVAQGTLPRARSGRRRSPFQGLFDPSDPFDPFGRLPGTPQMDDLLQEDEPAITDYPPEFATEAALDPVAFLRATVSPARALVGQQITLRVFAYGSRGPFKEFSAKEPTRSDFFSQSLVDAATPTEIHRIPIGDNVWYAAKIREIILFPLRAGELQIGAMEFGFGGGRYSMTGGGVLRQSQPLTLTVGEPPLTDRPPGYQLGDVGRYSLSAAVEPREVEAGGSISARVTVNAVGNPPAQLRVPTRTGVDFLTPTVNVTTRLDGELYSATKVFNYVIQLTESGTIDLGEVTLPYFNPDTQQYEMARAALGTVLVKPGRAQANSDDAKAAPGDLEKLQQSLSPRQSMQPFSRSQNYYADTPMAWLLLLIAPLLVLLLQGGILVGKNFARTLQAREQSPELLVSQQLQFARQAIVKNEPAQAASALERALYIAIEASFAIKARGLLRPALAGQLTRCGLGSDLSRHIVECLEECDGARFASSGVETMADLAERTAALTQQLLAIKKRNQPAPVAPQAQEGAS